VATQIEYWSAVEKFVSILNNVHSDDAPALKPVVLEPSDVFVYPPEPA